MKNINNIFKDKNGFASADVLSALAFFLVALIITIILSSRYFYYQNITENGLGNKLIRAKKEIKVVDTQKTEVLKRDIASKIRPVVIPVDEAYVKASIASLKDGIFKIKTSSSDFTTKEKELSELLEIPDRQKEKAITKYFLTTGGNNIETAFQNADAVIDAYLKSGVTESEIEYYSNETSILNILGSASNTIQTKTISGIIEHVLLPNLIVDEYATEVARKNAKSMVKPITVTFKKGDTIIKPGEPLTQVKKDALKKSGYNPLELNKAGVLGIFLLTCLCIGCFIIYVKKFEKQYLTYQYMSIIASFAIVLVYLCTIISSSNVSNYMMPFTALTIIVAVFTTPVLAFLTTILLLALISAVLFLEPQLFTSFVLATITGVYCVSKICYTKRFDLIKCGFQTGLILFSAAVIASMLEDHLEFSYGIVGLFNGLLSGIIALGVIPLIENLFKIVTPYGLIELADHNQALLANLQYKAPGTYHHSLMVANLCEAAAEAIGANPILARVGAFYHDIGKLKRPLFFIENQSYFGIENPHNKLNPRLSKMVITSHTKDGVELAKEHGLPQIVINFIQQHHGESLAGHFYTQAVALEGKENVQEEQFRYPGPKPNVKETAILMLADAVESAVRSLKNPTQDEIENMINRIITERLNDGQLSDSPLTLKDIKLIAVTFNRILRGMQHDRIKYQQLNDFEDKNKIKLGPSKEEKLEKRIQKKQQQKSADIVDIIQNPQNPEKISPTFNDQTVQQTNQNNLPENILTKDQETINDDK